MVDINSLRAVNSAWLDASQEIEIVLSVSTNTLQHTAWSSVLKPKWSPTHTRH